MSHTAHLPRGRGRLAPVEYGRNLQACGHNGTTHQTGPANTLIAYDH
jgi:hypothetical protein